MYSWVADKNAGIDITASRFDADDNDIAAGLENCVTLDGQTVPIHSLPMGGFTHTNVGNATARTNYAAAGQVVDGSLIWGGTSTGTANAQAIAITPAVTALVAGQTFGFVAGFSNTSTATLAVNATAATAIRKPGSTGPVALVGGEIIVGNTYRVTYDGTYFVLESNLPSAAVLRSYLAGLTLSTAGGSGTFGIAIGQASDSTNVSLMALPSAFTKTTSNWALGTAAGGLDTGAIAGTTWYHVFLIQRPDTGVVDVLFSLSPTAPTMPANYTLFRRIGSMRTDGSSHWLLFYQHGDNFYWNTPIADVSNDTTISNVLKGYTLTVPTGIILVALTVFEFSNSATVTSAALLNADNGGGNNSNYGGIVTQVSAQYAGAPFAVTTNTSATVLAIANQAANNSAYVYTNGWIDRRGRDA